MATRTQIQEATSILSARVKSLENSIRDAVEKFIEETKVGISCIDIELLDTRTFSDRRSTNVEEVKVTIFL